MNTTAIDRGRLYAKIGWRLIPLLAIVYIAAFIDRTNIAVAKLKFMGDIGLTEAAYGLGGGLFYLGYCLFEAPSNLVLAKIGAKRTLMRIMILWSLCSAAFALMREPWHFHALRFLLGAAEAGLFPGVLFYLSLWTPASRRARMTAMFMSAMALAGVLTGPISGAILSSTDGLGGLHAWQWLFLLEGLPGVGLAVVLYFALADRPQDASWLSTDEKAAVAADLASQPQLHAKGGDWRAALTDRRFYAFGLMALCLMGTINGISLWTPTVIKQSGVQGILQVSLLSSVPYLFAVAAQQINARRSDRSHERLWHAAIPAFIAAGAWLLLPQVKESAALSLAVLCVLAAATFAITGPFWTLPSTLASGSGAAVTIAMITTIGGLGAFASPIVVGHLTQATGALATGQYLYAGLIALAGVGLIALGRPAKS